MPHRQGYVWDFLREENNPVANTIRGLAAHYHEAGASSSFEGAQQVLTQINRKGSASAKQLQKLDTVIERVLLKAGESPEAVAMWQQCLHKHIRASEPVLPRQSVQVSPPAEKTERRCTPPPTSGQVAGEIQGAAILNEYLEMLRSPALGSYLSDMQLLSARRKVPLSLADLHWLAGKWLKSRQK